MLSKRKRKACIRSFENTDTQARAEGLALHLLRKWTNYRFRSSMLNPRRVAQYDSCIDREVMTRKEFKQLKSS